MFLSSHHLTLLFLLALRGKKQKRKKKIISSPELFVGKMNALGHEVRGGGEEGWLYLDTSDLQGLSCTEQHPALNASSLWQQELP